jgi:replicative DNA helicase
VITGEGRPLPNSLEAEEHLLSCCLIDGNDVVKRCLDAGVQARHFYLPAHGIVFETLLTLYGKQVSIDVAVLSEELKSTNQLEGVGGLPFILRISGGIPTTAQAGYFIERVIDLAIRRRIIREGKEMAEASYGFDGDLLEFTGAMAGKIQSIADFVMNRTRKVTQRGAARAAAEEAAAEASGNVDKSRWLHFPLAKLDREFLPIDPRQEDWLNIIAAPPSGGKSSYLRWLAGYWLCAGKKGVVFMLETRRERWLKGLAASFSGVSLRNLEDTAKLFPEKYAEFTKWMTTIEAWMEERLWVYSDVTALEDITRVTKELDRTLREREIATGVPESRAHGLDFVIGDYLQIVSTRRLIPKRTEELAHISRTLKQLHRSLDVPGFWGSQITREARNEGRRPTLADLGESKSLEENADRVHFIHTPPNTEGGAVQSSAIVACEVVQRKSRNGPKDVALGLEFDKPVSRFSDPSRKTFAQAAPPPPQDGRVNKSNFL